VTEESRSGRPDLGSPRALVVDVNLVFATTIVSYGVSFLVSVLVARALGPEGRGLISLYQSAVSITFAFLNLGISVAIIYFVSRREQTPREALEQGATISLFAAGLTAVGVAVVAPFFGADLIDAEVPYWMLIVAVPASIQFVVTAVTLRAQRRFVAMNLVELAQPVVLLLLLLAVEVTVGLTSWRAIIVYSCANLGPAALGYLLLGPTAWPRGLAAPAGLVRNLVFGGQGQVGNIIQFFSYRLDSYLVLLFVDTAGVGIYAISVAMSEALWFIANAVISVMTPRLSASDPEVAAVEAARACRTTILLTALAAGSLAVLSPFLVPTLFGRSFEAAVVPFLWLLPGTVALAGAKILSGYVLSQGKPIVNSYIAGVTFLLVVVSDLSLIPPLEITGAAIASSIAYTGNLALTLLAYRRISRRPLLAALVPQPADLRAGLEIGRDLVRRRPLAPPPGGGGA
jgi:O-antigen/teichoic acid export membrane protein